MGEAHGTCGKEPSCIESEAKNAYTSCLDPKSILLRSIFELLNILGG